MADAISTGQLTAQFLDMVAAERGGAANTLAAYGRDLGDLAAFLTFPPAHRADGRHHRSARLSGGAGGARICRRVGRSPAVGNPAILPLPLCGRPSRRRSGRDHRGTETRPAVAKSAFGRGGRPADSHRSGCSGDAAPDRSGPIPTGATTPRACGRGGCCAWSNSSMRPGCAFPN